MATTDFVVKNGLVVTEDAVIQDTTDSSSKDTGALIVEGGVGIEKKLYVGTDLSVGGTTTLVGAVTINNSTLATTASTFNLANTNATTVNFAGAATTVEIGAATGTTNINNNLDVDGDVNIDGGDLTVSTATFNIATANATTVNAFTAATTLELGAATGLTNINNNLEVDGDLTVDGGDLIVSTATFNLANTTATTVNFAGAATTLEIGAATGTTNVNNNLTVDLDVAVNGGDITTTASTFNLVNANALTVNFAGAATDVQIGAATGTTNINNNLDVDGDVNIDGGDLTVSTATFNIATANATTVNAFTAATTLEIGAATGTTNVNNNLDVDGTLNVDGNTLSTSQTTFNLLNTTATTVNFAGAGTTVEIGAATGTTNVNNNLTVDLDLAVNGGDITTNQTTFNLVNGTATTVNFAGAGTTVEIGAATGTTSINNNLTVDGNTTLGNASGDTVTFNGTSVLAPLGIVLTEDDATNNAVSFPLAISHTTSGVPALGIGTGIQFIAETSASNNEIGATIEVITTDVTATSEDFDIVFRSMTNGAAATEKFRILSTGNATLAGDLAVNGGDITTTQTTASLYDATATTVNIGRAGTSVVIGATTGTTNVRNALDVDSTVNIDGNALTTSQTTFGLLNTTATTVNFAGAATSIVMGAATGTTNVRNNLDVDLDLNIDGGDLTTTAATFNLLTSNATTVNAFTAATTLEIGAATGTTNINNNLDVDGTLNIDGASLTVSAATFNLANTNATTLNIGGAGTSVVIGAATGTTNIRNNLDVDLDLNIDGGDLTVSTATFNLANTNATTVNFAGAATDVQIGAATGTTNVNNNLQVDLDVEIRGGDLTTNQTTFNLLNTTATTVNFAGAATTLEIGAATGTTNINNNLDVDGDVNIDGGDLTVSGTTFNLANTTATTVNFAGAATTLEIGAATGTTNINNNLTVDLDVAVNGGDITTTAGTFNLVNANATTVNFAGAGTTIEIGAATGTTSINNNLTVDGNTTLGNANTDTVTFTADTALVPNGLTFVDDDAVVNAVTYPISLSHTTNGTPSNGIGTGIQFITETSNNNNEIGATIEAVTTDVTATSEDFDLVFRTMAAGGAAAERFRIASTGNITVPGDVAVNGGDITTTQTTFNLVNATATTVNFAGAATTLEIGAATGTTNINNNLDVDGTLNVDGNTFTTSQTTFSLLNTTATTVNFAGAGTAVSIGAATGNTTVNNNLVVTGNLTVNGTTTNINTVDLVVEDKNIVIGDVTTPSDTTADNGGITLKGATDKTLTWVSGTASWTSSENFNLVTGKTYKINGTDVLTATALGTGVTGSSLTSVGTIGTGIWQGTIISPTYGGTGVNNGSSTITLGGNFTTSGAFTTTLTVTGNTNVTLPTSGTLAIIGGTLAQFASTTSAQLAGVISDETGTGVLVYNTSPSFTTSVTTGSTSFDVFNATATTVNAFGAATTLRIGNTATAAQTVDMFTASTGASTYNFATGATANATTKVLNLGTGGAAGSTTNINIGSSVGGTLTVNSGTIVGALTTQNVFNTVATTVNAFGAATTLGIGATTGTLTLNNPTIVGSQTTQALFNTVATTVNFAGAATTLNIGAATGTATINNASVILAGDLEVRGGDLTTNQTTFNLVNATATTLNIGGAATALTIGAATGTATINNASVILAGDLEVRGGDLTTNQTTFNLVNATATTVNFASAGTDINIGATTGDLNIRNATVTLDGDLAVNGADITTTATGTSTIFNANTTTINLGQAATTISMGATTGTTTVRNSLAVNGNTTLGDASGDTVTINSSSISVPNTVTLTVDDAINNNISHPIKISHTTSGVPANGIGTGIQFITETTNNNNEIGATIDAVVSDVTATSEDFFLSFKTMAAGATAAERMRVESGVVTLTDTSPILAFSTADNTYSLRRSTTAMTLDSAGTTVVASATGTALQTRNGSITFATGAGSGITTHMTIDSSGNVGIGISPLAKLHVDGAIRVDSTYNFDSSTASLATVTQTVIATVPAATFGSGKFLIQALDTVTGARHSTELYVVHNGTVASATEYGTVFTGAAPIASYEVDINGGNMRVLATSASVNTTQYKVAQTLILA